MLYFNIVLYECLGKYLSFYEEIIIIPVFKDPDIVTGSDGFNRYYIDGEIQTKWQVY